MKRCPDTLNKERVLNVPTICAVILALFIAIPTAFSSELKAKYQSPKLPQTPFIYTISPLPIHLKSQMTDSHFENLENSPRYDHLATLGRVLFYDKSLSQNNLVSCSSCHKQGHGFDDPSSFSIGFEGKITARSSMGLANAAFNFNQRYFSDMRANSLEEQVLKPFFDPIEMGLKQTQLTTRVMAKPYYANLFKNAFGDQIVSRQRVAQALAGFVRSLISFNTFYDQARPDVSHPQDPFPLFSPTQNLGKKIFFKSEENGGAGCNLCHVTESFISLPEGSNNGLDNFGESDPGVGGITGNDQDFGKFRVSSLRNISDRAPYMHDGRFETLEDVIDHYSSGIKNHSNLGKQLKDESGKPHRFEFTQAEKHALVSFLQTLSDPQIRFHPKYSDPFNN